MREYAIGRKRENRNAVWRAPPAWKKAGVLLAKWTLSFFTFLDSLCVCVFVCVCNSGHDLSAYVKEYLSVNLYEIYADEHR
jgi:hypothetical protein